MGGKTGGVCTVSVYFSFQQNCDKNSRNDTTTLRGMQLFNGILVFGRQQ